MDRKHWLTLTVMLALALALSACGTAATATPSPTEEPFSAAVTDGLGAEIALSAKPQRIVSVTLGTDEILLDLVGPDRLVGVTYLASDATTSNIADRPELAQVPNVIEANPSPEQIIALEPDLVFVATFTDTAVIQQLKDAGLPVFAVGFFSSIEAMQENILTIGELVGEPEKAQQMVDQMDADLQAVAEAVAGAGGEKPTVLYLASSGWVAGSATTTDDIITRAGGINTATDLVDWNQVSEEAIIEMDPDYVILSPYVTEDEFIANPVYANLKAVQEGHVLAISDAYMSATSQYIVRGVEEVAHFLYPELVPEG
jgi:iron complex transport system substrate-binding protein